MMYTGVDWSGTPGSVQKDIIVFAAVHIDAANLPLLDQALAQARTRLKLPPGKPFKHHRANPPSVSAVFAAAQAASATASVHILHKPSWKVCQPPGSGWDGCLCDGVVRLAAGLPPNLVGKQVLQIDLSPKEPAVLEDYRDRIRQAIRAENPPRPSFKSVRASPDDGSRGGIIQVADMLAGEVWHNGIGGPLVLPWRNSIRVIP